MENRGGRREKATPVRILIVGAWDAGAAQVEAVLRQAGHDVHRAEVEEAWARFEELAPTMVVLTGISEERLALVRRLREHTQEARPFVLMRVGPEEAGAAVLEEAVAAGVDAFLPGEAPAPYLQACLRVATRHAHIEAALHESRLRAHAVLATTVDGIITIDAYGTVESFNPAAERIFGFAEDEVIGRNISMLMPLPYHDEHDEYLRSYRDTGRRKIIGIGREVVGRRKDGSTFPLDLAVSELEVEGQARFTGVVRDITERRRLEHEILRISEQERRRIGQDLHDGLGQQLTGIGLICQNLARSLRDQNAPAADEVEEITEMVREADEHARGLARGLIPVDLEATGLRVALQRLALSAERLFGIRCTFEEVGTVLLHDNTIATHLYRIAQEAVSNAVRHGRAQHVKISLAGGDNRLRLRLHDDGRGFPEALDEDRQGMGVRIMRHRARIIGASLEITGVPGDGTTVICTVRDVQAPLPMGGQEYG